MHFTNLSTKLKQFLAQCASSSLQLTKLKEMQRQWEYRQVERSAAVGVATFLYHCVPSLYTLQTLPAKLVDVIEADLSDADAVTNWSQKVYLGHLQKATKDGTHKFNQDIEVDLKYWKRMLEESEKDLKVANMELQTKDSSLEEMKDHHSELTKRAPAPGATLISYLSDRGN